MDSYSLVWESLPCEWCGCSTSEIVIQGPDRLTNLPGTFTMVRCLQCGLIRQEPRLNWASLEKYYNESYPSHAPMAGEQRSLIKRVLQRYGPWKRLRAVEEFQECGRMVEVGCGTGSFLEEVVRSKRWNVVGVEPVISAAEYTQAKLNIPVYTDLFGKVILPEKSFDAVIMWNVLEHLDHPVEDLRKAWKLLKPGGLLVCAIPNLLSIEAKWFGPYWLGWELPRHLYIFPLDTLRSMLNEIGFEWLASRCISTTYATLGGTLDYWTRSWQDKRLGLASAFMKCYWSLPVRVLLLFPLWVVDRLKMSTIITVFARKRSLS